MRPFEDDVRWEVSWLLRAGVPARGVRIAVRELVVTHIGRGPLGAHEIEEAAAAAARAACRLVRELDAPPEVVELVCGAALDGVRGHGGWSAQWLEAATAAVATVVDDFTAEERGRAGDGRR